MTATELNAGVLALRVSDEDREGLSSTLVGSYNNTTVGERSRVRGLPTTVRGVHHLCLCHVTDVALSCKDDKSVLRYAVLC